MKIKLVPIRSDSPFKLEKQGDTLLVNDTAYDFSALPEGAELPSTAINSSFFCGPVTRENGALRLVLLWPHGPGASEAERQEQTLTFSADGPIELTLFQSPDSEEAPE